MDVASKKVSNAPEEKVTLLDCVDVATLIVNTESRQIALANKVAKKLFCVDGKTQPDDLEGQKFTEICIPEEKELDRCLEMDHLLDSGHYSGVRLQTLDGREIIADVTIEPSPRQDKPLMVVSVRDVAHVQTLLKNLEEKNSSMEDLLVEMQHQNEELVRLDDMKNKFISLVSHELRTPLSGMMGYADLLQKDLVEGDAQKKEFLKVIYDEGLRLSEIVNDFLDLSRMMAGKIDLFVQEGNVLDPLQKAMGCIKGFAEQHEVELVKTFDEGATFTCYFDPDKVQQVFLNVMNNAIKFSGEGKKIEVGAAQTDHETIVVSIRDFGIGLKEEDYDKVFSDFEMVESINVHQKGTGLGMPLCKRFMEIMKGSIRFESTWGEGTTFFIEIPQARLLEEDQYKSKASDDASVIF